MEEWKKKARKKKNRKKKNNVQQSEERGFLSEEYELVVLPWTYEIIMKLAAGYRQELD